MQSKIIFYTKKKKKKKKKKKIPVKKCIVVLDSLCNCFIKCSKVESRK